jgi:hypothetical protein
MERLFQINIGYACFGIISENDKIIQTAPIGRWMIGKSLQEIKPYLKSKKAKVIEIKR